MNRICFRLAMLLLIAGTSGCPAPRSDAGPFDAGVTDAGPSDAGALDAGLTDAGVTDAGSFDAGANDAGPFDAGVHDAGAADAGANDAGADDAGAEPVSCAEWEVQARALVADQLEQDDCTAGLGGGCLLAEPSITCDDGSALRLCVGVGFNEEDTADLQALCNIPRASVCTVEETCEDKECWCARAERFGTTRLVLPSAAVSEECLDGLRLGDGCSNEGEICDVVAEEACVTDACQNVCVSVGRGACLDGVVRGYVSEFQSCHVAEQCVLTCELLEGTEICHESAACADDVCSPQCVVSVCDGSVAQMGIPRTEVIPCE